MCSIILKCKLAIPHHAMSSAFKEVDESSVCNFERLNFI